MKNCTSYVLLSYLTGPLLQFQTAVQKERNATKNLADERIFMVLPRFYG